MYIVEYIVYNSLVFSFTGMTLPIHCPLTIGHAFEANSYFHGHIEKVSI